MEIEKDSETTKLAIEKLLKSEGIEEYDISSINCLNEFINSYLTDLIKSVKIKMNLTKKEKIDILLVASALKQKQNNMYQSKSSIYEMTYMANKINSFELPPIPETPVVLKPPILNNLLRNNFQIYSEDLNKILTEKKNKINEEINMLGNKRNTKDIIDNNKFVKKETKNKRKKSISQENKTSNKKNISNPKINDSALSSNSLNNNNEGDYLSDLSDDSNEDNKESIINKKEDDFDMKDIGSNNSNDESDNSNDNNDSDDN